MTKIGKMNFPPHVRLLDVQSDLHIHLCVHLRRRYWRQKTTVAIWINKQSTFAIGLVVSIDGKHTIDQLWLYWTDLRHSMHESICNQIKRRIQMQTNECTNKRYKTKYDEYKKKHCRINCSKVDWVCIQIA